MNEVKFDFSRIGTGLKFICNLDQTTNVEEIWDELDEVHIKPHKVADEQIDKIQTEDVSHETSVTASTDTLQLPEVQLVLEETIPQIEETHFEETVEKEQEIILEVEAEKEFTEADLEHLTIEESIKLVEDGKMKLGKIDLIRRYYLTWQDALRHFPDLSMSELKNNTNITIREYIDQFPGCNFQELIDVFAIVPTDVNLYAYLVHIAQGALPAAFVRKTLNDLRTYYNNDPIKTIMNNFNLQITDLIHHFDVSFNDYTTIMDGTDGAGHADNKYKKKTVNQTVTAYRGYNGINSVVDLIRELRINHDEFLTYFDKTTLMEAVDLFTRVPPAILLRWFNNNHRAITLKEQLAFDARYTVTDYVRNNRVVVLPTELLKIDLALKQHRAIPAVQLTAQDMIAIYNVANKLDQNIRDRIIDLCINGFVFNGNVKIQNTHVVNVNFVAYGGNVLQRIYQDFEQAHVIIPADPNFSPTEIIKAVFASIMPTLDHVLQTKIQFHLNLTIGDTFDFYPANSKTEADLANAYNANRRAFANVVEFLDQLVAAEDKLANPINYANSYNILRFTTLDLINHFNNQLYFQDGSLIDAIKLIIQVFGPLNRLGLHNLIQDLARINFRTLTGIEWADIVRGLNFVTIRSMIAWSAINHLIGGNQFITFTAKDCVEIFDPANTYGLSGEVGDYATILREFPGITTRDFKEAFDGVPRLAFRNAIHLHNIKPTATAAELLNIFPLTSTHDLQHIFNYPNATALYNVKNTATKAELAAIFRRTITPAEMKNLFNNTTVAEMKDLIPRTTIADLIALRYTPLEIALSNKFTVNEIKRNLFNNDFRGLHQLYSTTPRLTALTAQQLWNLYRAQNIMTLDDLIDLYNEIEYSDLVLIFDPLKQNPQNFFNAFNNANKPTLEILYEIYNQDPNPNPVTPQLALQLYPATKPSKIDEIYAVLTLAQMIQLYHNQRILVDVEDLHKAYPLNDVHDFIADGITRVEMPLNKMIKLFRNQISSNLMNRFYRRQVTVQEVQAIDDTYTVEELIGIFNMDPMTYTNTFNNSDFMEFAKHYPDVQPNDRVWDLVGDIELDLIKIYYEENGLIPDRMTLLKACKKLATAPTVEEFFECFRTTIEEIYELYFKTDKNAFEYMLEPCLDNAAGTFEDNLKTIVQLSKALPSRVLRKINVLREYRPDFDIKDIPTLYNRFPNTVEELLKLDNNLTPRQCYDMLGIELKEFDPTNINKAYKPPKRIMKAPSRHVKNITEEQLKSYIDQILLEDDGIGYNYNLNDLHKEIVNINVPSDFDLDSDNYKDTISGMDREIDYNALYDFDSNLTGGFGVKVYPDGLKEEVNYKTKHSDKKSDVDQDAFANAVAAVTKEELSKYTEMMKNILAEENFFKNNCNSIIYADANKNIKMLLSDQLRTCNLLYILYLNYTGDNTLAFFRNFLKAFYKITFTYIHPSQLTINLMHALINSIAEESFKFKAEDLLRGRMMATEIEKRKEDIKLQFFEEIGDDEEIIGFREEIDRRLRESLKSDPIQIPKDLKFEEGSIKQKIKTVCKWFGFIMPDYYFGLINDVDSDLADNIYYEVIRKHAIALVDLSPNKFFTSIIINHRLTTSYFTSIFRIIASKTIPNAFNNDDRTVIRYAEETPADVIKQIYPNHPLIAPLKAYFKEKYNYDMNSVEDFIAIKNIGYFSSDWLLFRAIDYVIQADLGDDKMNWFNKALPVLNDLHNVITTTNDIEDNYSKNLVPFAIVYYYCDLFPKIYKYIPNETEKYISAEVLKSFFLYPLDNPLSTYEAWRNIRFGKDTRNAFVNILINSSGRDVDLFIYNFGNRFDLTSALSVNQQPDGSIDPVLEFKFKKYIDDLKFKESVKEQIKAYITLINKIRIIFYQIILHHPNIDYRDAQMLVGSLTNYITKLHPIKVEDTDKPVAFGLVDEIIEYDESFELSDFEDAWIALGNTLSTDIVDPSTVHVIIKPKREYKLKESYNNSFNSSFTKATPAMKEKIKTRHGVMRSMMFYLLTNDFKDGCSWFILKNDIARYIYDNPDIFTVITYKHVLDIFENVPDSLSLWLLSKHIVETQIAIKDPFLDLNRCLELKLPIPQARCKDNYLSSILFLWFIGKLNVDIWNDLTVYNCQVPCLKGVNTSTFFILEGHNLLLGNDNELKDFAITLLFESVNRLGIDTVNELASEFTNSSLKMVPMKFNIDPNSSESIKAYSNWVDTGIKTQFNLAFYYVLLKTLEDNSFGTNHLRLVDDFYQDNKNNFKQITEKRITGNDYNLFYKRFLSNVYKINKSGVGASAATLTNTLDFYEESFKTLVKNKKDEFIDLLRTKYLDKLGLFIHITEWLIIVEAFGKYNDDLTRLWKELETTDSLILNYEVIKRGFKVKSNTPFGLRPDVANAPFNGSGKLLTIDYNKDGSTITRLINHHAYVVDFFDRLGRELGKEVITLNKNFSIGELKQLVNNNVDAIFENDFINTIYDTLNLHESAYYDYSVDYVVLTALKIIIDDESTNELIEKVLYLISRTGSVEHIKQIIKCIKEVINNPVVLIKISHEVYNTLTKQSAKFFKTFNDVFYVFDNAAIYPELELNINHHLVPSWSSAMKKKSLSFIDIVKPGKVINGHLLFKTSNEPHKLVALKRLIGTYYEKSQNEPENNAVRRVYEFYRFGNPISDDKWPKTYIDLYLLEKISDLFKLSDSQRLGIGVDELSEICYNYVMYKVGLHNVMFSTSVESYSRDLEMYCYNLNKKLIPWLKMHYPYYPVHKIKPINKNEFKEIMYRKSLKHPVTPNDRFKTIAIRNGRFNEKEVNPKIDGMYAYNDDNSDEKLTGGSTKSELPTILKFIIIAFLVIVLVVIVIKIVKTVCGNHRNKSTKIRQNTTK